MQFGSVALALLGACGTATAFVEDNLSDPFATFEYHNEDLLKAQMPEIIDTPSSLTDNGGEKGAALGITHLDRRSGKPTGLTPDGNAPILPGNNRLLWTVGTSHDEGHGPPTDHRMLSEVAVEAVKQFLIDNQETLGIDIGELFAPGTVRTEVHADGDIQLSLRRTYNGILVIGSRVAVNIVAGNIVSLSLEEWGDIGDDFDVTPSITAEDAMSALAAHTGGHAVVAGEETCDSEIQILTLANDEEVATESSATTLRGTARALQTTGLGYKHKLIWRVCPKFEGQGVAHLFQGYVDAHTQEVMELTNTVDLFVEGGVYPISNDGKLPGGVELPNWPMSYITVGGIDADVGGNNDNSGGARLSGKYVQMSDKCGDSFMEGSNINWGTSGGDNCDTPGFGGKGNTHASRTGYYHATRFKDIARSELPNNAWLKEKLRSNVNLDNTCNAFWNGSTINFYRAGGGCANLGSISGVIVHEAGHGMDNEDVEGGITSPSGEGIADVYAALYDGTSCIGRGGFPTNCKLKGDECKDCTGVRDIDYMMHDDETPHDASWARRECDDSVHCKGHVYSEAIWSLWKRDLPRVYGYDDLTAQIITTSLVYKGAGNVKTWYNEKETQSCGGFGYEAFLAADDTNGNINDGTPHMEAIYDAFNRQQIACDSLPRINSGCGTVPVNRPVITATPGDKQVTLQWTSVDNANEYDVMRAEGGCDKGKKKINSANTARFIADTGLKNGFEYCYVIVPKKSTKCYGQLSASIKVTPGAAQIPIPIPDPPTPVPTPNPTNPPTPLPSPVPTPNPTNPPTPNPTNPPTPIPTNPPTPNPSNPPVGTSQSFCGNDVEKIFKLDIEWDEGDEDQISWELRKFNVGTETFDSFKSMESLQTTTRICVAPGTYEFTINDSSGNGMGNGKYSATFKGAEVFASDQTDGSWSQQTHIFCFGECASTSPSASPTLIPTKAPTKSGTTPTDFCGNDVDKIFRLDLAYEVGDEDKFSWELKEFDVANESFDIPIVSKEKDNEVQTRVCISPGTYEFIIYDDEGNTVDYVGRFGGQVIFSSDPNADWSEQRHIFCYGECASTSPSSSPSSSPSMLPSLTPSASPTLSPTKAPSTLFPTTSSITLFPTTSSITLFPTMTDELPSPGDAVYDPILQAPKCGEVSPTCSTGPLLIKRKGTKMDGGELNSPNSLDSCTDSNAGEYTYSESIETVTITSGTADILTKGQTAFITTEVICWGDGDNDYVDFYYTDNAENPKWNYISSTECSSGESLGNKKWKISSDSYSLPTAIGNVQAVRVNLSYRLIEKDATSTCAHNFDGTAEFYDDVDDVAFVVAEPQELI